MRMTSILTALNLNDYITNVFDITILTEEQKQENALARSILLNSIDGRPHNFNSREWEWKDLCNCQIKSSNSSDTPFLMVTVALLNYNYTYCYGPLATVLI